MANTKPKRGEVDRWTGNGITNVSVPPENKKYIEQLNAEWAKKQAAQKKTTPKKK